MSGVVTGFGMSANSGYIGCVAVLGRIDLSRIIGCVTGFRGIRNAGNVGHVDDCGRRGQARHGLWIGNSNNSADRPAARAAATTAANLFLLSVIVRPSSSQLWLCLQSAQPCCGTAERDCRAAAVLSGTSVDVSTVGVMTETTRPELPKTRARC